MDPQRRAKELSDDEISRLRPVLKDIVALGTPVSIDTMKAKVARFALDAGAVLRSLGADLPESFAATLLACCADFSCAACHA